MPETSPKPPRITRAYLDRYHELDEQRLAFKRQASDIEKLQEEMETHLEAHVRKKGGKALAVVCAGYRLAIKQKAGSVSWKNEFVKLAGEKVAEALAAAAPKKEFLSVEKA